MRKPEVKEIKSKGRSGTTFVRFEHNIKIGDLVRRMDDGREGKIVGEGLAGMPEVELPRGFTVYWYPYDVEILAKEVQS
jgi:hypothetical protein